MHYYQFNIGDYKSHTAHLDPIEDIAYRRMLDWYYLHEKPLPKKTEEIARLINMRTHCDSIATVLNEFFIFDKSAKAWRNKRADESIESYNQKSEKARNSAKARWDRVSDDANAMRTHSERNANHKPLTNNHKPLTIPPDINPTSWMEFEQHRKEMRQPLSDLARTKAQNLIKELSFEEQAKVIDNTIQNRWKGLFPQKLNGKGNETNHRPHQSHHANVVKTLRKRIAESGDP